MNVLGTVLLTISAVAIVYVLFVGYDGLIKLVTSLIRIGGYSETLQNSPRKRQLNADIAMPVSIIMPDCDKDPNVVSSVKDIFTQDYPEFELILICNSEASNSLDKLIKAFSLVKIHQPIKKSLPMKDVRGVYRSPLHMNLTVLDKEGCERYDAMNAGVNVSRYPIFVILGSGILLEKNALTQIAMSFARSFSVVVVGSLPRIQERGKPLGFLGSMQEAEYLRMFPAGLTVVDKKRLSVMPGTFGAYRKSTIIKERGFIQGGSETEMVVRLTRDAIKKREKYEFELLPYPVIINDPHRTLGELVRQRIKWEVETILSLWFNKKMLFNPKYGRTGMLDTPYYWFFSIIGPFIELLGCIVVPIAYIFGFIGLDLLMAFLAVEIILNVVVSLSAVVSQEILDGDVSNSERTLRRTVCAILNNFGYRQMMLVISVIGLFSTGAHKEDCGCKYIHPEG